MEKNIKRNIIAVDSKIKDVLKKLNEGIFGVIFVVDKSERVIGLFTDGDIRRAILKGASLSSPIENYMKKNFVFAKTGKKRGEYIKLFSDKIRHLPILDDKRRLVDFISWTEIWRMPIMEPYLGGNEIKYVSDCIYTNWISSQGDYVKRFENIFSKYYSNYFALTTSSGTSALHLSLLALGIGEGDEVLVPDITFAASANSVIHSGARPVFVDIDKDHWTIDYKLIELCISKRTKAIMPVHLYGHPCDMDPILDIAEKHNLFVIEDCAESFGSKYKGQLTGTFGNVGCYSFFSNKVITTGEGGMVITKDRELYEKMMILRDHGMSKDKKYMHVAVGYNYRMTNMQAAIGLAQMEKADKLLEIRSFIANEYKKNLYKVDEIKLPNEMEWAESTYWLYTLLINNDKADIDRDDLILYLNNEGIETRPVFYPLHIQPIYNCKKQHFPISEDISSRGISLPSSNVMKDEDIKEVCQKLKNIIKNKKIFKSL